MFVWLCHEPERADKDENDFFSSSYWYFTSLSSDTGRMHVAACVTTAAVLWSAQTMYECCPTGSFFCKEFLILTLSKRFCEGTSASAAVVCLYVLFSQVMHWPVLSLIRESCFVSAIVGTYSCMQITYPSFLVKNKLIRECRMPVICDQLLQQIHFSYYV